MENKKIAELKLKEVKLLLTDFQQKVIEEMKKLGYYHTGGGNQTNSIYFVNNLGNDKVRISDHMKGQGYRDADYHIYYEIEYKTDDMGNIMESYVDNYYLEEAIKEAKVYKIEIEKNLKDFESGIKSKTKQGLCEDCPKNTKIYKCDNCDAELYYCVECLQEHKGFKNCDYY